jgi:hypothetical protein
LQRQPESATLPATRDIGGEQNPPTGATHLLQGVEGQGPSGLDDRQVEEEWDGRQGEFEDEDFDPVFGSLSMPQRSNPCRRLLNGGPPQFKEVIKLGRKFPEGNALLKVKGQVMNLPDGSVQLWTGVPRAEGEGVAHIFASGSVVIGGQEPGRSKVLQQVGSWTSVNPAAPRPRKKKCPRPCAANQSW